MARELVMNDDHYIPAWAAVILFVGFIICVLAVAIYATLL